MNPAEVAEELRLRVHQLDDALSYLSSQTKKYAEAENVYRHARARAWVVAPQGTVAEREAWVDGETADVRKARDLAEGMKKAGVEAVRSRQAQLSAWQSMASILRSELELAKYGPA